MRNLTIVLIAAATVLVAGAPSRAGLDPQPEGVGTSPLELVVMEADGCIYCDLFRRDVLPSYETSQQGKEMPAVFLDVNEIETAHLVLKSAVTIVPTFVVVRQGKELGRISGYVGPEDFYHSISYVLASAP